MRRRQRKGFGYYLRRLLFLALFISGAFYAGKIIYLKQQVLPVKKILADSVLKGRQFEAKVQQIESGNLRAYLLEEHSNPIISIRFLFQKAGVAHEPEDKGGLATLLSEMLTAGGGQYDAEAFKEICAEYGIKVSFSADADDFSGVLQFPSQYQDMAVKIFKSALYEPRYDESYFELAKTQQMMALKLQQERPEQVLNERFKQFIFAGHPYERQALGSQKSVFDLTVEDLENYRQAKLAQNNLLIGVAGDLSADKAVNLLQKLFGQLPKQTEIEISSPLIIETTGAEQNIDRQSAQAVVKFAAQGTFRDSIDFYPLYMANFIFGESGLTSRLNKTIREDKGLTYGIYTYLTISDEAALIQGSFSATPENLPQAKEILRQEWLKLGESGVSAEELAQAKKSLLASYNLRFAEIDSIASMLLAMQKYRLGIDFLDKRNDYIAEVSLQEVNAAAKKYFRTLPDMVYIGARTNVEEKK